MPGMALSRWTELWCATSYVALVLCVHQLVLEAQITENGGHLWCSHHTGSTACLAVVLAYTASLCSEPGWPSESVTSLFKFYHFFFFRSLNPLGCK